MSLRYEASNSKVYRFSATVLRRRINGATTGEGSNLTGVYIDYKLYEVGGGTDSVEISSAKTLQPTVANGIKLLEILLLFHYYLF